MVISTYDITHPLQPCLYLAPFPRYCHFNEINVKNFRGSLTTVVMAQNDTSKTANITYTIFDRTLVLPLQATAFLKSVRSDVLYLAN